MWSVCFVSFSINICHIVGKYFIFCICEIFVSIEVYSGLQCFSWGSRSQTPSPENHSSHFETIMSSSKISHHPHHGEFCILDKKWENMMSLLKFPVSKTKSIASALIPLGRRKKHNLSPSLPPHPALYCFYGIFWLNNCTESVGNFPEKKGLLLIPSLFWSVQTFHCLKLLNKSLVSKRQEIQKIRRLASIFAQPAQFLPQAFLICPLRPFNAFHHIVVSYTLVQQYNSTLFHT